MAAADANDQRVTNATLLLELKHLGEKVDELKDSVKTGQADHDKRIRELETSNAATRMWMSVWNGMNSLAFVLSAYLGLKH